MNRFFVLASLIASSCVFADAAPIETETVVSQPVSTQEVSATTTEAPAKVNHEQIFDVSKISEAFGHMIAKNISQVGAMLDIAKVIKGLQDSAEGKISPMTEKECADAISAVQEKVFHQQCKQNLDAADKFLKDKSADKNVVSLEAGKVQYTIESQGAGTPVESHFSPVIRYKGKYLDGTVFGASAEGEKICLDEIIPGLKSGMIGMKEGERRTIYIHPDLAYGTNGYLPPNSLLTFEIELVQANAPDLQENELITPQTTQALEKELAGVEEHVR